MIDRLDKIIWCTTVRLEDWVAVLDARLSWVEMRRAEYIKDKGTLCEIDNDEWQVRNEKN